MSKETYESNADVAGSIKCKDCGAHLTFAPETESLICEYCGANNKIEVKKAVVQENDYEKFILSSADSSEKQTIFTVKCVSCGASTTLPPNVASCSCPYCDTPLVIKNRSENSIIRPKYLLPFKIERRTARDKFIDWAGSRWFAPGKLRAYAAQSAEKLKGVYMPYWTYDSITASDYSGLRGEYYFVSETYRDGQGKIQTRQVQRTAWYPANGHVNNRFDDVLVCASHSLPATLTRELEPWDLNELLDYDEKFLAGFVTECYQTDLRSGFEESKGRMQPVIEDSIKRDIGGDVQQIHSIHTDYQDITFKHILLPLWISAYKYNDKTYRFTVNARTGEVQGERPYSGWKIFFFCFTLTAIIAGSILFYKKLKHKQEYDYNTAQSLLNHPNQLRMANFVPFESLWKEPIFNEQYAIVNPKNLIPSCRPSFAKYDRPCGQAPSCV